MSPQQGICPGCGAKVHPQALECPECGRDLQPAAAGRSRLLPLLVGVGGVAVAFLAGAGVWLLLAPSSGAPPEPRATASQAGQQGTVPAEAASSEAASTAPQGAGSQGAGSQGTGSQGAGLQASAPPSAVPAPAGSAGDVPLYPGVGMHPGAMPVVPGVPQEAATAFAPPPDVPLDMPKPEPGAAPQVSEESRRSFARSTQQNFAQNGLDLAVTTSGPESTIIQIKFNFPAKTAVELIASGPFPRQCRARGFATILFTDPSGTNWSYDLATDKLSQK